MSYQLIIYYNISEGLHGDPGGGAGRRGGPTKNTPNNTYIYIYICCSIYVYFTSLSLSLYIYIYIHTTILSMCVYIYIYICITTYNTPNYNKQTSTKHNRQPTSQTTKYTQHKHNATYKHQTQQTHVAN